MSRSVKIHPLLKKLKRETTKWVRKGPTDAGGGSKRKAGVRYQKISCVQGKNQEGKGQKTDREDDYLTWGREIQKISGSSRQNRM